MKKVIFSFTLLLLLAQGVLFSLVFMCMNSDRDKEIQILYILFGVPGADEDWNTTQPAEERVPESFHLYALHDEWELTAPGPTGAIALFGPEAYPVLSLSRKVIVPPPEAFRS